MWRSRWWVGRAAGIAALAMAVGPITGCARQSLARVPEAVEGVKDEGPLAGVSWSVINDSKQPAEGQAPMVIGQHLSADRQAEPSLTWLDLHAGRSRAVNREPDLLRHEF